MSKKNIPHVTQCACRNVICGGWYKTPIYVLLIHLVVLNRDGAFRPIVPALDDFVHGMREKGTLLRNCFYEESNFGVYEICSGSSISILRAQRLRRLRGNREKLLTMFDMQKANTSIQEFCLACCQTVMKLARKVQSRFD